AFFFITSTLPSLSLSSSSLSVSFWIVTVSSIVWSPAFSFTVSLSFSTLYVPSSLTGSVSLMTTFSLPSLVNSTVLPAGRSDPDLVTSQVPTIFLVLSSLSSAPAASPNTSTPSATANSRFIPRPSGTGPGPRPHGRYGCPGPVMVGRPHEC